jgi:hypothetical protein
VVRSDFDFDQAVRKSHAGSRGVDRNEKFRQHYWILTEVK